MNVYLCEESLEGLLTAVFYAYYNKEKVERIACAAHYMPFLGEQVKEILPDSRLARRVRDGIVRHGSLYFDAVKKVYATERTDKYDIIYQYLRLLFEAGRNVEKFVATKAYRDFDGIRYAVEHEIGRLQGFIRFKELTGGAFYAFYGSDNNVLEFLMPHFVARFNIMKFLIHDLGRGLLGVYDGEKHYITAVTGETVIQTSPNEDFYCALFEEYLGNVTIMTRRNTKLRDGFFPKRYRFYE